MVATVSAEHGDQGSFRQVGVGCGQEVGNSLGIRCQRLNRSVLALGLPCYSRIAVVLHRPPVFS
ncbi:hypothetical protein D3C72_2463930 [compost metagenome]